MSQQFVSVRPHSSNPDGWVVFDGEKELRFLNGNFFMDKKEAEKVAIARRHVNFTRMIEELTEQGLL